MSAKTISRMGSGVTVSLPFGQVIGRVKEAFQAEGFGMLSEIDVQKALYEKIGERIEPYTILGVCNPHLASRAIAAEHEIGLLLPCTVLVHECDGSVKVSAQDPLIMMQVVDNEALKPIAEEAGRRIERALQRLAG